MSVSGAAWPNRPCGKIDSAEEVYALMATCIDDSVYRRSGEPSPANSLKARRRNRRFCVCSGLASQQAHVLSGQKPAKQDAILIKRTVSAR